MLGYTALRYSVQQPLTSPTPPPSDRPGAIVGMAPPHAELRRLLRAAGGCVQTAANIFFAASPPKRTPQAPRQPTPPSKPKVKPNVSSLLLGLSLPRPKATAASVGAAAAAAPHREDLEAANTLRHLFAAPPRGQVLLHLLHLPCISPASPMPQHSNLLSQDITLTRPATCPPLPFASAAPRTTHHAPRTTHHAPRTTHHEAGDHRRHLVPRRVRVHRLPRRAAIRHQRAYRVH